MNIIEWIKGVCTEVGGVVPDAPEGEKYGRVYEVPAGILPRVLSLYEEVKLAERVGRGKVANYNL